MLARLRWCGAACALFLGASGTWAMNTGQCLPAGEVRATLAAEGQNSIIIGNRTGYGSPTVLIFTSKADGSKGYMLRGDKPLGQPAETICVDSVYREVRLNDITRPGIPNWAKFGGDKAKALAACKRERLGYQELCQASAAVLSSFESHGTRVMLMATGTAINPRDKSVRTNQRILAIVNPADYKGDVEATTIEGASYMLSAYAQVSYTQHGNAMLSSRH